MLEQLQIRTATLDDAEPLTVLAEQTFRDTFAADNTVEHLEAYVRSAFTIDRIREELDDDDSLFLLAFLEDSDRPVGYAKLRSGEAPPCVTDPDLIELQRIYVDRSAQGHGVGAALMRASLDMARTIGCGTVWLGVWEHNTRAISFYERWGFKTVGDQTFLMGADPQRDLVMTRALRRE
ncbi:MAG TPA: GNAT family N-acetyltransferase [Longimicrobiaceae bacterium]